MDWLDKKFRQAVVRLVLLTLLVTITYRVYSYYEKENLSYYEMQNQPASSIHPDSVRLANLRADADRMMDSMKRLHNSDSALSFSTQVSPYPKQNNSSASLPIITQEKKSIKSGNIQAKTMTALQGPSAVFSRECTIGIGKTIPITVLWANAGAVPVNYQLVTIKVEDIADKKARFTIEDSFGVLLFSQTGYAANEKIIIEDERHNINISVLEVNTNSVVIKIVSHLNDGIVSKLRKV